MRMMTMRRMMNRKRMRVMAMRRMMRTRVERSQSYNIRGSW